MEGLRSADGFGGLILLLAIGFILNLISKAQSSKPAGGTSRPAGAPGSDESEPQESLSLEKILREIERVKREAETGVASPPPARSQPTVRQPPRRQAPPPRARTRPAPVADAGPLGRHSGVPIPAAEEVEVRDTLGGQSLEVEREVRVLGGPREVVDRDDEAAAIVQQRIAAAQARNRGHIDADHQAFDQRRVQAEARGGAPQPKYTGGQLRSAVVWREILGPPRALDEL